MREDLSLEQLIELGRRVKMTPADVHAQRVSLAMGLRSKSSTLTREKVEDLLNEIEGQDHLDRAAY